MKRYIILFLGAAFLTIAAFPIVSRAATSVSLQVSPQVVPQGGTAAIVLTSVPNDSLSSVTGSVDGTEVIFFPYRGRFIGFWSAPAKAASGWHALEVVADGSHIGTKIGVASAEFPVVTLAVPPELKAKGFTSNAVASNLKDDTSELFTAVVHPAAKPLFSSAFRYPLASIAVTGRFGTYYRQGKVMAEHLGVDLKAATGTPVYAVNDGIALFAAPLTNYGNTVLVDHGAHIFSLSLHLDRFAVAPGDVVKKGDVIGYSGETGYAVGPHLHLSMWVDGASINPLQFIAATQKVMR